MKGITPQRNAKEKHKTRVSFANLCVLGGECVLSLGDTNE